MRIIKVLDEKKIASGCVKRTVAPSENLRRGRLANVPIGRPSADGQSGGKLAAKWRKASVDLVISASLPSTNPPPLFIFV